MESACARVLCGVCGACGDNVMLQGMGGRVLELSMQAHLSSSEDEARLLLAAAYLLSHSQASCEALCIDKTSSSLLRFALACHRAFGMELDLPLQSRFCIRVPEECGIGSTTPNVNLLSVSLDLSLAHVSLSATANALV